MSVAKVAKLANVSTTTVSFVINRKPGISQETIDRVMAAVKKSGYIPKSTSAKKILKDEANGLRTGNIGILMPTGVISTVPFYARLFEAIHYELDAKYLKMSPLRISEREQLSIGMVSDIDGMILCAYDSKTAHEIPVPFVSIFGHPDPGEKLCADHIEPANDRIGVLAAKYFLERGHKNVWAVNPSTTFHPAIECRNQYFANTINRNGCKAEVLAVPFLDRDEFGRLIDTNGVKTVGDFVSQYKSCENKPTGIFVPCDSHLVLLQKCFKEAGIKIGIDVEFMGCNNENVLDGLSVRPATIDINPEAIAKEAVTILLQRLAEPDFTPKVYKIVTLEPTIVCAGSGVKEKW